MPSTEAPHSEYAITASKELGVDPANFDETYNPPVQSDILARSAEGPYAYGDHGLDAPQTPNIELDTDTAFDLPSPDTQNYFKSAADYEDTFDIPTDTVTPQISDSELLADPHLELTEVSREGADPFKLDAENNAYHIASLEEQARLLASR